MLALGIVHAQRAAAQPAERDATTREPRRGAVYASTLGLLLGDYTIEYEGVAAPHATVGLGVTYQDEHSLFFSGEDGYDLDASAKLRYYPSKPALAGFSIGALVGGTVYKRPAPDGQADGDANEYDRSNTAITVGYTFDYNWLLGAERRVLVGVGAGRKRRFVRNPTSFDSFTRSRPTLRLVAGVAF